MIRIRQCVQWLGKNRVLSVALTLLLLLLIVFLKNLRKRSDGTLTSPVIQGRILESVYGIGTVTANRSFQLKPGVIGTISDLFVREGDSVKKGDRLAEVDRVVFRAPFDGTITALPFKVGENAFPQVPILTLVDLQDRYLVVSLEQQAALRVQKGQAVKMSFDTLRSQAYGGTVQAIYPSESSFLARIDLARLPMNILVGMTCDVAISIREKEHVLLVPVAALEDGKFVWVKRGRAIPTRVEVRTGVIDKEVAEMVSGDVREGDRLLIRKEVKP